MEAVDFDNVISPSASASPPGKSIGELLLDTHHHFKSITKLFRILEICLGLVLLSWTFTYLPFAVRISGEHCRHFIAFVLSPIFIFLLGNLIVATLLFKAGHFLSGGGSAAALSSETGAETDLYEDFIKTSVNCSKFMDLISSHPEEIEYEDKQTIFEVSSAAVDKTSGPSDDASGVKVVEKPPQEVKTYWRTQSENFDVRRESAEEEERIMTRGRLRRPETEKCRKVANPGVIPAETVYVFDELSSEEFQETIEAFIAKQINFHREEKLAIVLHSSSSST